MTGFVILTLLSAFFAATRTQVGRDELKRQLVQSFNSTYQGELSIGRLTGNLLYTLYAEDVQLSGPDGNLVASIDSVVIEPRWSDLIRRTFSVKTISIHHPVFEIGRDENGDLNLAAALSVQNVDTTNASSAWTFKSATLRLHDGRVVTRDLTSPDESAVSDRAFDFANTSFEKLNLEARIDWNAPDGQIDLLAYSGSIDHGRFAITGNQSQLLIQGPRISVNNFEFSLGSSTLSFSGFANIFQSEKDREWWDIPFLFDLAANHVSFDELGTLFPILPVAGEANVSALIQGPASDITISWIRIGNDRSDLELSGMVSGLPDSAAFDISFVAHHVEPEDLRSWLPTSPFPKVLRMDSLAVGGDANGVYRMDLEQPFLEASGNIDVSSNRGAITLAFEAEGPFSDELAFDLALTSNNTDLSYWTGNREFPTSFNGAFRLIGSGYVPGRMFAEFRIDLTDLILGPAHIPAVTLTGQTDGGRFQTTLVATQVTGGFQLDVNGSFTENTIDYAAFLQTRSLDVGPLVGIDSLLTRLNVQAALQGTGLSTRDLAGELSIVFDSSDVALGSQSTVIRPHEQRLAVRRPGSVGPRVTLRGDIVDLDVNGDVQFQALAKLGTAWLVGFSRAVSRQAGKPLYATPTSGSDEDDLRESLLWADASYAAENFFDGDAARIDLTASVHALDFISSYWPPLPLLQSSGSGQVIVELSGERMAIDASYVADSIRIGTIYLSGFQIDGHVESRRIPSIVDSFSAIVTVQSDSLVVSGQPFRSPSLNFEMQNRQGLLTLHSPGSRRVDEIDVVSRIVLGEDSNQILFDRLRIDGHTTYWTSPDTALINIYSDALTVSDIELLQFGSDGPTGPRIMASGLFSSQDEDTLYIQTDAIALHELSRFVSIQPHLDGRLDARLSITGGENQPTVAGNLFVEQFGLDYRILGDLVLDSRFIPGSPDLDVRLELTRADTLAMIVVYDDDTPAGNVSNQLEIYGKVRFPRTSNDGSIDKGALDLDATISRADLFFLKYIFNDLEDIGGFVSGSGRIEGTPTRPLFDLDLTLQEGRFRIPKFNLQYALTGDLRIDGEGIQIDGARLRDRRGGTADAIGSVLFNDYRFFSLDLGFDLDDFQIMNVGFSDELPFYGFLWASGSVTLDGQLSGASLHSTNATVSDNSEIFIPVVESATGTDDAYIIFTDSAGYLPDFRQLATRSSLLGARPDAERRFLDALDMDLSIFAPSGSTIHLVVDPLIGDVINAESTGRVQIKRDEGEFSIFGDLQVSGGDYLFTAGDFFVRRFIIDDGGSISWDGDPVNATLDIPASYRTRASLDGLPGYEDNTVGLIPLIVSLQIGGTVDSPAVELGLAIDRSRQNILGDYASMEALEAQLNSPDRATEYATSVLLTNSFRLTTDSFGSGSGSQLAFNSVSQLVSSQVNRFINEALPNVDFNFGLQGESAQELDVTYGVALRLLNERLIIRGEGVYQGSNVSTANESLQGEFQVEVRLSPNVSVEVFFRREGDILESADLTNTAGAGLSYQTEFSSWKNFWRKLFGWLLSGQPEQIVSPTTDSTQTK